MKQFVTSNDKQFPVNLKLKKNVAFATVTHHFYMSVFFLYHKIRTFSFLQKHCLEMADPWKKTGLFHFFMLNLLLLMVNAIHM